MKVGTVSWPRSWMGQSMPPPTPSALHKQGGRACGNQWQPDCANHVLKCSSWFRRERKKASTRVQIMHLRRAECDLFRKRVDGIAWESQESRKACKSGSTGSCKHKIIQFSSSGGKTHLPRLPYLIRDFTEISEAERISIYRGLRQKQAPRWAVHGIDVACMNNVRKTEAQSGTRKGHQGSQEGILLLH